MTTTLKTIKQGREYRSLFAAEVRAEDDGNVLEFSFSSEAPVERWFGPEVLRHDKNSADFTRLNDGAPFLFNHDRNDLLGVLEKAWIGPDRRGHCRVRFSKSERGQWAKAEVDDGVLRNVSFAYQVRKFEVDEKTETYTATDWLAYEVSLVTVPADQTVGIGRADDGSAAPEIPVLGSRSEPLEPPPNPAPAEKPAPASAGFFMSEEKSMTDNSQNPAGNVERSADQILKDERERVSAIDFLCVKHNVPVEVREKLIAEGASLDTARGVVLDLQLKGQEGKKGASAHLNAGHIGLSEKEAQQFSFTRILNALANPGNAALQRAAAFEYEVTAAATGGARGVNGAGVRIPADVLSSVLRRDLVAGTASAGGNTVATNLLAGSFIDLLRNRLVIGRMGAMTLTGLEGNVAIPRATGGATAYWVAESGAPSESQQAFDQVALTPKTVGAFTDISRRLLIQSSIDVEAFVRNDLAVTIATEVDRVAINGSGASNQPRGILNTSGIGSVAGGANGAAPTFDHLVDLETAIESLNAETSGYLTNVKVRGKLKKTQMFSGTNGIPVWGKGREKGIGDLNGYDAYVTNQVPSNLTKGTASGICSAIIAGDFGDLIMGMWSGLDLLVDPYTGGTSGTVRVIVLQDVDVAVRHPESFSAMADALTA